MKIHKFPSAFSLLISLFIVLLLSPKTASAATPECPSITVSPGTIGENNITIGHESIYNGEEYKINVDGPGKDKDYTLTADEIGRISLQNEFNYVGEYDILLEYEKGNKNICESTVTIQSANSCKWKISPEQPIRDKKLTVEVTNINDVILNGDYQLKVVKVDGNEDRFTKNNNLITYTPTIAGTYLFRLYSLKGSNTEVCKIPVTVGTETEPGEVGEPSGPGIADDNLGIYDICQGDHSCLECLEENGSWTALGCIPTDPLKLTKWVFPYLLSLGGLAAFSLIVFSGIRILTSAGNPEVVQGAKETITSAVTGLLFIILSLFLLRLIGINILKLPGLENN